MNQRPLPPQGSALPTAPHPDTIQFLCRAKRIISQKTDEVNIKIEKSSRKRLKNSRFRLLLKNSDNLRLFDFNCCADSRESFFDLLSFVFSNCFFNCLGSALNEFLSFLKSETCDLTDCLDNVELLVAEGSENYVEFCFFFSCGSCCAMIRFW